MSKYFLLLISLILPLTFLGQKHLKNANVALDKEQYAQAIQLYLTQIKKSKNKPRIIAESSFKIGYCYKKLSQPEESALYFKKAIDLGYSDPVQYLYYGEALQMLQKYDSALIQYEILKVSTRA